MLNTNQIYTLNTKKYIYSLIKKKGVINLKVILILNSHVQPVRLTKLTSHASNPDLNSTEKQRVDRNKK